ncbi:MAG: response regulator transcription factor [Candidatus Riflebacteria bacterium]|nr:response regulator transcription factor [Candidatus Riflebacteria bacterium]
MKECRIVLADDHSILREGLKSLLSKCPECRIAGEAVNGIELLTMLKSTKCDLAIVDISMPEMDGLTALKEIKRKFPTVKVLMLSMMNDFMHFERAKTLGASGYIAKEDAGDELVHAIEKIMSGKMYVSPSVMSLLAERQIHLMDGEKSPSIEILTKREKQVLGLIAKGITNKNIAAELKISIHTVENHRAHLSEKLGATNVTSLVKFAIEKGLI